MQKRHSFTEDFVVTINFIVFIVLGSCLLAWLKISDVVTENKIKVLINGKERGGCTLFVLIFLTVLGCYGWHYFFEAIVMGA